MMPDNLTDAVQWTPGLPVPPFDPMGLPVPAWLLLALAYLTFALHLLAMNFTLGSVVLALWTRFRKKEGHEGAGRFLGSAAPLGFSYLVTFGIPPLLFLQVLYGQFFYSSSVLVGAFWISVIPLLIVAYGHLYVHKLTRDRRPDRQQWVLGIAALAMLAIGFIYVNNLTLSMTPESWMAQYGAHPAGGALNLGEPTVFPRWILFLAPAPFVAGLALLLRGTWLVKWGQEAEGRASQSLGFRAAVVGVVLEVVGFVAWMTTLPADLRDYMTAGPMTGPLATWAVLGVAALVLIRMSAGRGRMVLPVTAAVLTFLSAVCLVVARDHLRREYLADHFDLAAVVVNPQWGMFTIFLVSMVLGLGFIVVLTVMVARNLTRARRKKLEATT